ncbi:MAG: hypothetical protein IJC27_08980 [Lentisphaeria bacterium]|nr:hypothetical protein [Lentisphaeria bacterium]
MILQILILFGAVFALYFLKQKDEALPLPRFTMGLIFIQAFVIAAFAGAAVWIFTGTAPESYSDFIGGFLAISGLSKSHEYHAFYSAAAVFLIAVLLLMKLHRLWESDRNGSTARSLVCYSLIPALVMTGQALWVRDFFLWFIPGAFSVIAGAAVLAVEKIFARSRDKDAPFALLSSIFLLAASFAGIFICQGFGTSDLFYVMLSLYAAALLWSVKQDNWKIVLCVSQLGIPLCFCHLLPPLMELKDGNLYDPGFNLLPNLLMIILISISYASILFAYRKKGETVASYVPTLVLAAFISAFCAAREVWPYLIGDDYHEGEAILPWYLLIEQGALPYADYAPSRGLLNYFAGFLVWLFKGQHDFSMISGMLKWVDLPLYITALALLRKHTGTVAAVAALTAVTGLSPAMGAGVLAAFLLWLWLTDKRFEEHPAAFLRSFIIFGILGTLYSLTDFLPFYMGLFPLAFYELFRAFKVERKSLFILAGTVLAGIAAVLLISPVRRIIFSMIELLFLQSGSYTAAHCVPHMPQMNPDPVTPGFFWDSCRYAFITMGGIFIATLIFLRKTCNIRKYLALAAFVIFAIIMIQRAGGRVDTGNYSRIYLLSALMWAVFMPAWYKFYFPYKRSVDKFAAAVWLIGLGIFGTQMKCFENLTVLWEMVITEPENCVNAAAAGLPDLGAHPQLKPDHFKHHQEVKKFLSSILKEGETVWDLSNNSALYAYHDLPLAMRYPAYFYAAEPRISEKLAAEVKEKLPLLALIEGRNIEFHEGKLPLRAYPLYTLLMDNYRGFKDIHGKVWMIRKGEESRLENNPLVVPGSLDDMDILAPAVADRKIDAYPQVWAESWETLSLKAEKIADLTPFVRSTVKGVLFPAGNIDGDFMLIKFDRPVVSPALMLRWDDDFNGKGQPFIAFSGRSDRYLIPLSTAPNWYLSRRKHDLGLLFVQDESSAPAVLECSLWKRR